MNTINKGHIWHNYQWKTIFEYLPTKEHNQHKAWWIEKFILITKIYYQMKKFFLIIN